MKNSQITILFLIGFALTISGIYLKYDGWQDFKFFVIIGMTFNTVALFLLISKMLKGKKTDSFLDS